MTHWLAIQLWQWDEREERVEERCQVDGVVENTLMDIGDEFVVWPEHKDDAENSERKLGTYINSRVQQ